MATIETPEGFNSGIHPQAAAIGERLAGLRLSMQSHQLDAYIIPSVDEHINEYLPENRQRRAWISGFTGSAGDCVVFQNKAWVFVDSRYYEQADTEVPQAVMQASKQGLEGHASPTEKIREIASKTAVSGKPFRLGYDPFTMTVGQSTQFEKSFKNTGIICVPVTGNLIDTLWNDAPLNPQEAIFALPPEVTGFTIQEKLNAVQAMLADQNVDAVPVTKLDQIAWLFNCRGRDIPYNPLFIAYALVTTDTAYLFTEAARIEADALVTLQAAGVQILPYKAYPETVIATLQAKAGLRVLIDGKSTTIGTKQMVLDNGGVVIEGDHPVELLKAVKNEAELAGMREANLKASRGKIRAWYWLEQQIKAGTTVTEASFRDSIERFYAEEEGFFGLSFNTISGAGPNGSIVHYGTPSAEKKLEQGEMFLIDSGCQFWSKTGAGTTDDTRTMLVGETATALQKLRFTEVLKAHINCAIQQFPKGTDGARLDGITRATMWQNGLDYGHGTGHGVGAFLNVHEGPNGIHRMASKAHEPGMINSIEPGFYEPGWGGIRLENLYEIVTCSRSSLGFESLTYVPFDPKLTDFSRLSLEQKTWLAGYNATIIERIAPTLPEAEAAWLKSVCAQV